MGKSVLVYLQKDQKNGKQGTGLPKGEGLTTFLVSLTLATEVALLCAMYIPSRHIHFSQPTCFPSYGRQAITKVLWPLPFVAQGVLFVLVIGFYFVVFRFL